MTSLTEKVLEEADENMDVEGICAAPTSDDSQTSKAFQSIQEIEIGPEIGQGQFSTVYAGRWNGVFVSVKKQSRSLEELDEYLRREIEILRTMTHPNVIRFIGADDVSISHNEWDLFVITEYAPGGELSSILQSEIEIGMKFRVNIAFQLAQALDYLHSHKCLHRDVKSENVLIDGNFRPQLADFGMARFVESEDAQHMTICGTDEYMAPELLFDEDYGRPVDVYAFGMVLLEVLARREVGHNGFAERPVQNNFRLNVEELRGNSLDEGADPHPGSLPKETPPSIVELAVQCLEYEPENRPSIADVVGWIEEFMGELVEDDIPPPNAPIELNWEFQSTDEAAAETEPIQAMNTLVTAQSIGKGSSALSTMATPPKKRRPTWSATQNAGEPLTGFLFKKSTGRAYGVNKSWKKRFFELDKRNFSWYKDHSRSSFRRTVTEKDEKSIQFTKDMVCRTTDEKAHRFAIFRKTAEEEVIISRFAASNKSERDLWVMRIQNAIENFSD